jgi:hypothetical protein
MIIKPVSPLDTQAVKYSGNVSHGYYWFYVTKAKAWR